MSTTRWAEDGKGAMVADLAAMVLELPEVVDEMSLVERTRLAIVPGLQCPDDDRRIRQAFDEVRNREED